MGVETFSIEVTFRFNHALFRVESISRGILEESMPEHSHGHGNYEIHYISSGKGSAVIDNSFYSVLPNTLYVTGPHVIHSQTPDKEDPLTEYCIYLSLDTKNIPDSKKSPLAHFFLNQVFWYGQDNQNVLPVELYYASLLSLFCAITNKTSIFPLYPHKPLCRKDVLFL